MLMILFICFYQVGRLENAIGWYHSHPGYGCWLSGIDVSTQMLNQQFQEPFVAVVVNIIGKYFNVVPISLLVYFLISISHTCTHTHTHGGSGGRRSLNETSFHQSSGSDP